MSNGRVNSISSRDTHNNLELFAKAHHARTRRDDCGEVIIAGRHGHIYCDGTQFGLVLIDNSPGKPSKARALLSRRRAALTAGFIVHQIGDYESVLWFDANDCKQARLALHLIGYLRRRQLSPEHRKRLASVSKGTQFAKSEGSTTLSSDAGASAQKQTTSETTPNGLGRKKPAKALCNSCTNRTQRHREGE